MVQVHTCVSVHCDQCGDSLGSPGFEAHFDTEMTALDAAAEQGWLVGPDGRLYCSACGPVLTCEAEGHEFTPWRAVPLADDEPAELVVLTAGTERPTELAWAHPISREYRYCHRCCLHESRRTRSRESGLGNGAPVATAVLLAGSVVGEVA